MRYRMDWNSKEWKEFSKQDEINPVSSYDWWVEYQKYHQSFDSFSAFLQKAQDAIKVILPSKADATKALAAVALLDKGVVKRIRINDLDLEVME